MEPLKQSYWKFTSLFLLLFLNTSLLFSQESSLEIVQNFSKTNYQKSAMNEHHVNYKGNAPFVMLSAYSKDLSLTESVSFRIKTKGKWSTWTAFKKPLDGQDFDRVVFDAIFIDTAFSDIQFKSSEIFNSNIVFRLYIPEFTEVIRKRTKTLGRTTNTTQSVQGNCTQPAYQGRLDWCPSGNCTKPTGSSITPTHIVVHHSAGNTTSNDFAAVIRGYWNYHVNTRGWADIGYNWLIDPNGVIYEGRGDRIRGAHSPCMNGSSTGICLVGEYTANTPNSTIISTLEQMIAWDASDKNIDILATSQNTSLGQTIANVSGHRTGKDMYPSSNCTSTTCPGNNVYNMLSTIRANAANIACYAGVSVSKPKLDLVSAFGTNGVKASWSANTETNRTGYRLYYATNNAQTIWKVAANESTINTNATSIQIGSYSNFVDVPTSEPKHYRITAVGNDNGSIVESSPSITLSKASGSGLDTVLIVDGFDRRNGGFTNAAKDFIAKYVNATDNSTTMKVASTKNESIISGAVNLNLYKAVIWTLGDESTSDETFSNVEQNLLKTYLENGGNLFVTGDEVGWDLFNRGTTSDKAFYNNYLKANYVDDGSTNYNPATGTSIMAGKTVHFNTVEYTTSYPDAISSNGGTTIFNYAQAGKKGGVFYQGTFGNASNSGSVMYLSFNLETAPQSEMTEVITLFLNQLTTSNTAPVAVNDTVQTLQNTSILIDVIANDTDDNNSINASSLVTTNPSNGTATVVNNKISYTPNNGYFGSDSFTYTVKDTNGATSNAATVSITVVQNNPGTPVTNEADPSHPKRDMRGVWISTVANLDWPSSSSASSATQKNELIAMLDDFKSKGINALFFQVRPASDALYASTIDPWSHYLTGTQGQAPSPYYDPLTFAITEAHNRGMELHAWINPLRVNQGNYTLAASHVKNQHASWVMENGYTDLLNPGIPAARDYIVSVVSDIVSRYDVDGIHFDDYFYPYGGTSNALDASAFASYNPNNLSRANWRRNNVNQLIASVYLAIQQNNTTQHKDIAFGVSPFGIWKSGTPPGISGLSAYDAIYTDALAWLNAGTVDYVSPQLYWKFGGGQDYASLSAWWDNQAASNNRINIPGLALYRLGSSDGNWAASEILNQINENRASQNGATYGQLFFRAKNLKDNLKSIGTTLKNNQHKYPSVPINLAWKETYAPNAPTNLTHSGNSLSWNAPSVAYDGDSARKYIVYRFASTAEISSAINNGTKIVAVVGSTSVNVPAAWTNQPNNVFVVTALDNNNNESVVSNVVEISGAVSYCNSQGNSSYYEWIKGVKIGSVNKTSGNDGGYSDKTSQTFTIEKDRDIAILLQPGYRSTAYNENWKIWIDLNKDGDFDDAGEALFDNPGVAKNNVSGSIRIPASAAVGVTRMRVSMNGSSANYTLNPCTTFAYGEVEDYSVNIIPKNTNNPDPVCSLTGNNSYYEWIAKVTVNGQTKNSGNDGGYKDYSSFVFNLNANNTYAISLSPGYRSTRYNENWKIWIDFNQDGDFTDAGEELYDNPGVAKGTVTGSINIPNGIVNGNYRMRVGMNGSSSNYTLNPCGSFTYGEVEDYIVSISGSAARDAFNIIEDNVVMAYPNPVKDILTISSKNNITNITAYGIDGSILYNKEIIEKSNLQHIQTDTWKSGLYILVIQSNNSKKILKIIKP